MYIPSRTPRIERLVTNLYAKMPEVESARACIITESYKRTEHLPIVLRRAHAFADILDGIPIIIRDDELIVGSSTLAPRGCQTFPEFSHEWLEAEFDTLAMRPADPFYISEETKRALREAHMYWRGKTTSDLAAALMAPEATLAIKHNIFTVGNYFYNGVGHLCVAYDYTIHAGYTSIIKDAHTRLEHCDIADADYAARSSFLNAVIISCEAVIRYAARYADLAESMAGECADPARRRELSEIAAVCRNVPKNGAKTFREACQSFWFIQQLIQLESSGHSISPGRFDQYMYPYYKADLEVGRITQDTAQELIDCIWVKLNDLNKCRDYNSALGFSGYGLFQNLIVGGQDVDGRDATNVLSYMCINASQHVFLPQPSLSVRVWNKSPHDLLLHAAKLTRTGIGLPAYFNDEVIIPSLMNRGLSLEDARDYCIIGCVEPQKAGQTDGWHDAAFFNMCRPLELIFSQGVDKGVQVGKPTYDVESLNTFGEFFQMYKVQHNHQVGLLVHAINAVDAAHATRAPLPFLSSMVSDCMRHGKTVQEGGAEFNFTGPQGFGVANVGDALYAVKKLVFEQKKYTMGQLKRALQHNFGRPNPGLISDIATGVACSLAEFGKSPDADMVGQITEHVVAAAKPSPDEQRLFDNMLQDILDLPKFGNDIDEVDEFARMAAGIYSERLTYFKNPRGGMFQAGLYPVSANVPLGAQTGATPDGRLAGVPIADGVSPTAGNDTSGPTAAANSVAKLDHMLASNGTLFNQKFHPSALAGDKGLNNFVAWLRAFFEQKGMHVQFNVVDRETLLDAKRHPERYKHLIVRVAGYSALFTSLSEALQDDIIARTVQSGALR